MFRFIVTRLIHFFLLIVFRVKKVGEENIPKDGAYILCPNHTSNWDPVVIVACTKRKMYVMSKEEVFKNEFVHWFGRKMLVFPVKRGKQDVEAIKKSLRVLKDGELLLLFPEGTRNGMKKRGKLQNGASLFAARSGVPVIPIGIQGTYKPFRKITINYGEPIDFSQYKSKKPEKEVLDNMSKEIMENIIKLTNK